MNILVTAGPTREPLDPVRFISNRSSGRMGYAVAAAARSRGHEVTLVTGPTSVRPPAGVRVVRVTTAREMLSAVLAHARKCDALVMAAAVSDWRPERFSRTKLKKTSASPVLRLVRTPDILARVSKMPGRRIVVGFAAETGNPAPEARRKLAEKKLDLIAANDVSRRDAGFDVPTNRLILIPAGGRIQRLPLMSKRRAAAIIVKWIESRMGA